MEKKETKVLNYRVIIEKEHYDDGTPVYSTYVPTLGIADYGPTIEEALENTKEGIKFHIECLIEEGEKVPFPDKVTVPMYRYPLPKTTLKSILQQTNITLEELLENL